jgi:elongation factor Ts
MSYKPTMAEIKQLRARSGAGIRDCKNALIESQGEIQGAFDWLRKRGIAKAAKKSGRVAAEGTISAKLDGNAGVLLEVNCETDFAAGTDDFKKFVDDILNFILSKFFNIMEEL